MHSFHYTAGWLSNFSILRGLSWLSVWAPASRIPHCPHNVQKMNPFSIHQRTWFWRSVCPARSPLLWILFGCCGGSALPPLSFATPFAGSLRKQSMWPLFPCLTGMETWSPSSFPHDRHSARWPLLPLGNMPFQLFCPWAPTFQFGIGPFCSMGSTSSVLLWTIWNSRTAAC